jgi:hypothetical protein
LRGCAGHATTCQVTKGTGETAAAQGADGFARDWQALRADSDIQFAPLEPPAIPEPAETPGWLQALYDLLGRLFAPLADAIGAIGRAIGISGQVLTWLLMALGAALLLYLLWRLLEPLLGRRASASQPGPEWTPDAGEALALLDDADRLAAEGRYDEATRLLLKRSVGQIAAARPDWLEPSSTAREIAELPALPQAARGAFSVIAERVERSLFALRSLSADDWHAARAAYAEFALAAPRDALAVP